MTRFNGSDRVSSADEFRALERARVQSLVERDMAVADALHSPEFHLITPGGTSRSRDSYLTAVRTGVITYLEWQPGDIVVRRFDDVVLLRYQARIEMPTEPGGVSSFTCWHTDSYELHDGFWQVVFSQATRIVSD